MTSPSARRPTPSATATISWATSSGCTNAADSFTHTFDYGRGATNYLQQVALAGAQVTYQYDAAGNVSQENGSRHYQWDAADQLRQFATWTGAGTAPTLLAYYIYSGGQRVKKLTQTSADTWQVTVYAEGGFEHRYEVSQGSLAGQQTQLAVLDGQHHLYQRRSGDALGDQRPASLYALDDHLGSAAAHTNASGQLVSREEYYPFGETSFGSTAKQRYRFCGKELDEESGLYYYGMRYYAAWLCRFVSVDPLAKQYPYYTPYQYAGNKSINFIDLDGAEPAAATSYLQAGITLNFGSAENNVTIFGAVGGQVHNQFGGVEGGAKLAISGAASKFGVAGANYEASFSWFGGGSVGSIRPSIQKPVNNFDLVSFAGSNFAQQGTSLTIGIGQNMLLGQFGSWSLNQIQGISYLRANFLNSSVKFNSMNDGNMHGPKDIPSYHGGGSDQLFSAGQFLQVNWFNSSTAHQLSLGVDDKTDLSVPDPGSKYDGRCYDPTPTADNKNGHYQLQGPGFRQHNLYLGYDIQSNASSRAAGVSLGINSDKVSNILSQNKIHRGAGLPDVANPNYLLPYFQARLTGVIQ